MKGILIVLMILISSQAYSSEKATVGSIARNQCIEQLSSVSRDELIRGIVSSFIIETGKSNEYFTYCINKLEEYLNFEIESKKNSLENKMPTELGKVKG